MRVFFDTEFTGLHQNTTLISIGCVTEGGLSFYAELTDYDQSQVDDWLHTNVIANLVLSDHVIKDNYSPFSKHVEIRAQKKVVAQALAYWLELFEQEKFEMWSDCYAYDWVLFCELFGGAFGIPKNVYYIPFDLATLFKLKGIDPDINREEYAGLVSDSKLFSGVKHSALWDARVIRACYDRAMAMANA